MELALAELALEEPQQPEEDVEFVIDKGKFFPIHITPFQVQVILAPCHSVEEEDVFESDFASTDEEAAQEGIEEDDKGVLEEERRERKVNIGISGLSRTGR